MLSTSAPARLPIPFANNAGGSYIRTIPQASQIGITGGAASLYDGFVPLNMAPTASGGIPPFGQDMNGILNWLSSINQWYQAGGPLVYNSSFATSIGGYPKGAVLQAAGLAGGFWRNTADGNTTDPDSGGAANWVSLFAPVFASPTFSGTSTFSGPAVFSSSASLGSSATATTQTVNDNSTKVSSTAYADRSASNAGSAAVSSAIAACRQGMTNSNVLATNLLSSASIGCSVSYTAPTDGALMYFASFICGNYVPTPTPIQLNLRVDGSVTTADQTTSTMFLMAVQSVSAGAAHTIEVDANSGSYSGTAMACTVRVGYVFIPSP